MYVCVCGDMLNNYMQIMQYNLIQEYSYKYKLSQTQTERQKQLMQMQCRNYMQQYSRTKSIRQINKTRSSYKQLLQNSKTRQNSNNHTNLKLSASKKCSERMEKNVTSVVEQLMEASTPAFPFKDLQPLANTQNIHNVTNISYGKLNSKMKLKVTADKSMRSMSSNQQLKQHNNIVGSSMVNIGVGLGLGSQKKKPKIVTLTANSSQANTTSKKGRNFNQLSVQKQHCHSIQRSQNTSVMNSKYSTNMAHQAAYMSIKRNKQKEVQNSNNMEVITLNTSLAFCNDDGSGNKGSKDQDRCLEKVYDRVKVILETNKQKQRQWQVQRNYYKTKIKQLQKQIQQQNKKQYNSKISKNTITQPQLSNNMHHHNSSNSSYYNHSSSVNLFTNEQLSSQVQKNGNRKFTCNR